MTTIKKKRSRLANIIKKNLHPFLSLEVDDGTCFVCWKKKDSTQTSKN